MTDYFNVLTFFCQCGAQIVAERYESKELNILIE